MMAFDLANGDLLYEQDISPQGAVPTTFCYDMVEKDGHLIVYGDYGNTGDGCLFFMKLDEQFNILEQNKICDNNLKKRGYDLDALSQGGYILAYGEEYFPGVCSLKVAELDNSFNVSN